MSEERMQVYEEIEEGSIDLMTVYGDYLSIDSVIESLQELKTAGATHIKLDYDVYDSSLDTCQIVGVIERFENDEEFQRRMDYEEKKRLKKEREAAEKIQHEKGMLRFLRNKYPDI